MTLFNTLCKISELQREANRLERAAHLHSDPLNVFAALEARKKYVSTCNSVTIEDWNAIVDIIRAGKELFKLAKPQLKKENGVIFCRFCGAEIGGHSILCPHNNMERNLSKIGV